MEPWMLAILLKPFAALLFGLLVLAPVIYAIKRLMPDGIIRGLLLFRIHDGEHYTIGQSWRQFRSRYWPARLPIVRDRET